MFLSADEIRAAVDEGQIRIEPFEPRMLKPASYVMRLGNRCRRWRSRSGEIDIWSPDAAQGHLEDADTFRSLVLRNRQFLLASTQERIALSGGIAGLVASLSHLARFGVFTHTDAFLVSPGFGSDRPTALTLEIASVNPAAVRLRAGTPVCHLGFVRVNMSGKTTHPLYKSIYEGKEVPHPPLLYEEMGSLVDLRPDVS